jgi:2-polyprenyl-3-methyl-5-hydroxy-6-metoxy-1,4-benzoquinol methylase
MEMTLTQSDIHFQSNLYESKNPTRRWIHQARRAWVLDKLGALAVRKKSALEVGTGCGTYTGEIGTLYKDATSIDVNQDFIAEAQKKFRGVNCFVADIETLNTQRQYDVIVMSEVLEHVGNTQLALDRVFAHLVPRGYFVLTTPNKFSTTELVARLLKVKMFAFIAQKIYGEPVDDLGHISLRTRMELIAEIDKAGFVILAREDISFYLPVIAEFGGQWGKRLLQFMESKLKKHNLLRNLLWTQCYVLTKF